MRRGGPARARPSTARGRGEESSSARRGGPAKPRRDPRADVGERPQRSGTARPGRRDERAAPRRVERPQTAAETRAAEVRARRTPRPERTDTAPPPWEREQWIDDGPLRSAAEAASRRALGAEAPTGSRRHSPKELAPEVGEQIERTAPATSAAHYRERLATAADALDRGRFDDARRMVQPVVRDLPEMAFGHEIAGLALYRTGQWRKAAAELETARHLDGTLDHHPVLADCYRALRRYQEVDELWRELRDGSPAPALMAEGRIVAAGALADRGDLAGAIKLMGRAATVPKRVREHHVRQWYVLGDLYDRSGDVVAARRFFGLVYGADPAMADVAERLRGLGR